MRLTAFAALVSSVLIAGPFFALPAHAKAPGEGARSAAAKKATRRPNDGPAASSTPAPAKPDRAAEARADEAPAARGPARIDFDDRLIQGQTNKSGAVYLFDRKELVIRSMVQQRTSYRQQIVQDVLAE